MNDLRGSTAFITGGANGIGRAIAECFAREGVAVAIADIDPVAAATACKELEDSGARALAIGCDVTSRESLDEAADEVSKTLGPVHLLVNNAGAFTVCPLEETTRRDWEWLPEINVLGVVNGLHAFLPGMKQHGEPAHIINTASVAGHIGGAGLSIYAASKFAVVGLSECLRLELAESPIDVSVLCPGVVKTGLIESSLENRPERHGGRDANIGEDVAGITAAGTDPAAIGDPVVEGIRAREFYIFTHPALRPAFEARFDGIMAAFPSNKER
jgi:NAD(P)-dependent dehydrogenase (short-subunit alcohol dehydrogenase family)